MLGNFNFMPQAEAIPKARKALQKALELDADSSAAHSALSAIYWSYDWNWQESERELKRAIALSPGDATAHHDYGGFLMQQGRLDESIVELRMAERLDPLCAPTIGLIGVWFEGRGDEEQALENYRKVLDLEPKFYYAYLFMSRAYRELKRRGSGNSRGDQGHRHE